MMTATVSCTNARLEKSIVSIAREGLFSVGESREIPMLKKIIKNTPTNPSNVIFFIVITLYVSYLKTDREGLCLGFRSMYSGCIRLVFVMYSCIRNVYTIDKRKTAVKPLLLCIDQTLALPT